jgi:hypothetical protein
MSYMGRRFAAVFGTASLFALALASIAAPGLIENRPTPTPRSRKRKGSRRRFYAPRPASGVDWRQYRHAEASDGRTWADVRRIGRAIDKRDRKAERLAHAVAAGGIKGAA